MKKLNTNINRSKAGWLAAATVAALALSAWHSQRINGTAGVASWLAWLLQQALAACILAAIWRLAPSRYGSALLKASL